MLYLGDQLMYLANKYTNWYYSIIQSAKNRELSNEIYFEKHHIIPRSLGGNNKKENIVALTAKEHFICHLLLPKMTENLFRRKMIYALWCIINAENGNQNRYKITSRQYDLIKNKQSIARKLYKHTSESRRKISEGNKGKRVSEETKKILSAKAKQRGTFNSKESIQKAKETRKINGTEKSMITPKAIAKRVETRKINGALNAWISAAHSPSARKKAADTRRKTYIVISPAGEEYIVNNLKEFCNFDLKKYNGLTGVANGIRKQWYGWTCRKA